MANAIFSLFCLIKEREKEIVEYEVANSPSLWQAVKVRRYGSLININHSKPEERSEWGKVGKGELKLNLST